MISALGLCMGHRCICIENGSELSFSNNYLVVEKEGERFEEFLDDVDAVLVNSLQVRLSSYLLNELLKRNVRIIFANEKKNPAFEMMPYASTHDSYAKLREQIGWRKKRKDMLWARIIKNKIRNQHRHLKFLGKPFDVRRYVSNVKGGDASNSEAHAARTYFSALFGSDFSRDDANRMNAGLNYGYTILLSLVNRAIASFGYSAKFGIHHDCQTNNFNFSCDIMEPFRTVIDRIVYDNRDRDLDRSYKRALIDINMTPMLYKGKEYKLETAVSEFFLDAVRFMNGDVKTIGEVIDAY